MARLCIIALCLVATCGAQTIQEVIQSAAQQASKQFNCSIAIAFHSGKISAVAAAGFRDSKMTDPANVADPFVWGSVTKVLTGASILRLQELGLLDIYDPVAKYVDPYLAVLAKNPTNKKFMNYTSVAQLFGPDAAKVTLRDLAKMTSGETYTCTCNIHATYTCTGQRATRDMCRNPGLRHSAWPRGPGGRRVPRLPLRQPELHDRPA
jgi:CubicO group peptidase (beta-lactamase class C family)